MFITPAGKYNKLLRSLGNYCATRSINIPRLWRQVIREFASSITRDRFGNPLRYSANDGKESRRVSCRWSL
jgi:hypothetical protein